jgi:hypothetical protein
LGEELLRHLGMTAEAAHLGALFDHVEAKLAVPQPSEGAVSPLGS